MNYRTITRKSIITSQFTYRVTTLSLVRLFNPLINSTVRYFDIDVPKYDYASILNLLAI